MQLCQPLTSSTLPIKKIETVSQQLEKMGSLSPILSNKKKKKRRVKRRLLPNDNAEQSDSTSASNSTSDVTKTPSASNTIAEVPEMSSDKDDVAVQVSCYKINEQLSFEFLLFLKRRNFWGLIFEFDFKFLCTAANKFFKIY